MKALVHEGEVVQLAETEFDVHPAMTWVAAPEGCAPGWVLAEGALVPPPPPPPPLPAELLAALADLRWQRETGGLEVDGITLATDRDSQALLTGAVVSARGAADPGAWTVRWKTASGFVALDGLQVIALGEAVRAHVQACFDAEAAVGGRVAAGEITTLEELRMVWEQSTNSAH